MQPKTTQATVLPASAAAKHTTLFSARLPMAAVCAAIAMTTPAARAQCVQAPSGAMVAWYAFDESAPPSLDLAASNLGLWSSSPPTPVSSGKVGVALKFNGNNNYVQAANSIVTNFGAAGGPTCTGGLFSTCPGNFSIDAWINIAGVNVTAVIVDKRIAGPIGYEFFLYGTQLGLQLGDGSGYSNFLSPTLNMTTNTWHHVAVTVNRQGRAGVKWYFDGVLQGSSDPSSRPGSLANNAPLTIGATSPAFGLNSNFFGTMDELEIYNRVLTQAEVQAIFTAQSHGKCKP